MGSFAGSFASPMLATYSGSKAFLAFWSQSLAEEYKKQGITVQLINTYFVVSDHIQHPSIRILPPCALCTDAIEQVSNMSKIRRASISTPTANVFVKSTLSHIGLPCGSVSRPFTSTPYWAHSIADWVIAVLNAPSMVISYTHRKLFYTCPHCSPLSYQRCYTNGRLTNVLTSGLHIDIRKRAIRKKEREAKKQ